MIENAFKQTNLVPAHLLRRQLVVSKDTLSPVWTDSQGSGRVSRDYLSNLSALAEGWRTRLGKATAGNPCWSRSLGRLERMGNGEQRVAGTRLSNSIYPWRHPLDALPVTTTPRTQTPDPGIQYARRLGRSEPGIPAFVFGHRKRSGMNPSTRNSRNTALLCQFDHFWCERSTRAFRQSVPCNTRPSYY